MIKLSIKLSETIHDANAQLQKISEDTSRQKYVPEKWSYREIIGHLIDSAYNNRVRFINAQFKDDLIFDEYDQDGWVKFMKYQEIEFHNLIEQWVKMNLELADIIACISESKMVYNTVNHNLHKIAFNKVPLGQPANLQYLITDYISHMHHHLDVIMPQMF